MISYPLGGLGAGMLCLEGTGGLGSVSIWSKPDIRNNPNLFSVISVRGAAGQARVLEAPIPDYRIFAVSQDSGNGLGNKTYGLPRYEHGEFTARFPFATVHLSDDRMPISAELTGWSPFIPNDEDSSSLPFAGLEYALTNTSEAPLEAVWYFNAVNFIRVNDSARIRTVKNGFVFEQPGSPEAPQQEAAFSVRVDEDAYVDAAWFRYGWFDPMVMLWNNIEKCAYRNAEHLDTENGPSKGATIAVPFALGPGESKTIRLRLAWYVPYSELRHGKDDECCTGGCACGSAAGLPKHRPWYTAVLNGIDDAARVWEVRYDALRLETQRFTDCFFDSTLPEEILDAVSANLSILKSPTTLRQRDGRFWAFEGCCDSSGCCSGTCTHVWNYAQALCHLFPRLERGLRESEFNEAQDDETGHQQFRIYLPIRKAKHDFHAACDGQLGGIIKMYRDWHIGGDTEWLRGLWPRVRKSMEYCIGQWDTELEGILKQPHHNTYDIEFWGPDALSESFYLSALRAFCEMGEALGECCDRYKELYNKGRIYLEEKLYNGEYFHQIVMREGLNTQRDPSKENPEARALFEREGPKYQYGNGCLSDSVVGFWLGEISGLSELVDDEKLRSDLLSVYQYNFKRDLSSHVNTQRPGYAMKHDAGLVVCTWPKGGRASLPMVYCDEVFTGIEYQVASHLISKGYLQEGLEIVRAARARYDGTVRNPYNEYECGHWYARALSSYALLQAYTGVRYDNLTKTLYCRIDANRPYKTFLSTATGYGTVESDGEKVTVKVVSGQITVEKLEKIN